MNQQGENQQGEAGPEATREAPGPRSGYRENQDHRGEPGGAQQKDGRQLPEDTGEPTAEPGANVETSVPEPVKRGD